MWVRKQDEQLNGSKFEPPKKFTDEGDGIMLMCHIHASHEMGLDTIAFRRIPCHCKACRDQMDLEWVDSIVHVQDQPRFADVPDCKFRDFLFTRNKWYFAQLDQRSEGDKDFHEFMDDDANLMREQMRHMVAEKMLLTIDVGKFGAVLCEDDDEEHGCHVVEWISVPWIDQNTKEHMCDAVHWNKVPNTRHWHTRSDPAEEDTMFVNHVVLGDLPLHEISRDNEVPKRLPGKTRQSMTKKHARKVDEESHESILQEMSRRAKLEIKQRNDETIAADSGDSEDDLSVESEKSSAGGD